MKKDGFICKQQKLDELTALTVDGSIDDDAPKGAPRYRIIAHVYHDGSVRHVVTSLTGKSFIYLTMMAHAAHSADHGRDAWIDAMEIEPGHNQSRYIYRLKLELHQAGIATDLIENDRRRNYRLRLRADQIEFEVENIRAFPDHQIAGLFPVIKPPDPRTAPKRAMMHRSCRTTSD